MRKYLIAILLLLLAAPCFGWMGAVIPAGGTVSGAACLGNEDEGFEGTGAPTNWSDPAGSPDYDYTSTVLECTESLHLAGGTNDIAEYDPSWGNATHYITAWIQFGEAMEFDEEFLYVRDAASNNIGTFIIKADEEFACTAEGGTENQSGTPTSLSANTTYKIKVKVAKGSGANAEATLWIWNGSAWDQECTSTDGTSTADIDHIRFRSNTNGEAETLTVDYLKFSSSDIASPD